MTEEIRRLVASSGPIPFERFIDLALYGAEGFYTGPAGGAAGRRGDFVTSPEVGPLFGAVLARYLDAEWERLDRPEPFTVVDVGAGPGTLARSILSAAPACTPALRYVAVEVSAGQRARHPDGVEPAASLPGDPFDGVVVANELLDNLPFRLAVFDGGWREAYVDVGPDGRFVEVLSARLDPRPEVLPADAAHGARAPLIERAGRLVGEMRRLVRTGSVLAVDYGVATTGELARRPWSQWLRTYRANRPGGHYLADPGAQDVTVDVPFDQLPAPDALRTQAQFLHLHGIGELVEEGRRVWSERASTGDLAAVRMRSRIREGDALVDPAGLGAFLVAEWRA